MSGTTYEAYAVNLRHKGGGEDEDGFLTEVTRWTDFEMVQKASAHGRSYLLGADGNLYLAGGKTDNGKPIKCTVKTGLSDFGSEQMKNPVALYVGGRIGDGYGARIYSETPDDDTEEYPVAATAGASNTRVRFGRGYEGRYWGFGLSSCGGSIDIDKLSVEIRKHERS